jgi:hypothetical protein
MARSLTGLSAAFNSILARALGVAAWAQDRSEKVDQRESAP